MTEKTALTALEQGSLWGAYMNASLTKRVLAYFLEKIEDQEILEIVQAAQNMNENQLQQLGNLLQENGHQIPQGFTEEDVNVNAPKLFTDGLMLQYTVQFGMLGMVACSTSITMVSRDDIYGFFSKAHSDFNQLHHKAILLAKSKGVYITPPIVPVTQEIDFVKKQRFLNGWFGDRRPLLTMEIAHLFSNVQRNALGAAILTGFSQVAQSEDVVEFLLRGIQIAKKHVSLFSQALEKSNVPVPMGSDSLVTDSSEIAPFSDKLIMAHTTGMIALGISFYGGSISTNTRKDLAATYARLSGEIGLYAEDGTNIMIRNGWLEEPPRMVDREHLAKARKGEADGKA